MVVNEERKVFIDFTDEEVEILKKAKKILSDIYDMDYDRIYLCAHDYCLMDSIYTYAEDIIDCMQEEE